MRQRELQEIFEKYGEVLSVNIIMDHLTRLNKGFGFVKMPDQNQALAAISALNGREVDGQPLVVNESKFKKGEDSPPKSSKKPDQPAYRKKFGDGFQGQAHKKGATDQKKGKPGKRY